MGTEVEALLVSIEAKMTKFEKEMSRASGVADKRMRQIEQRFAKAQKNISAFGVNALASLTRTLGTIGVALSTREVLKYADAWTKAKNALAVAGVTGERQVQTLARLFELSQANAAPLEATVQLYGRASMASENLGANQQELIQLTDAVGLALKVSGQGAAEASGALLQLSQALSGSNVQAEEYNSLVDGLYPLLQAAAAGSDRWRGSVAKLTADVKAGKVSSREFFRAILNGTDELRTRAASASQTLGQALTKIDNAYTRYIGSTDENLGATQRLIAGLNSLADNFDETADTAVQFATVLGAAVVGRGIGGIIATIPAAVSAIGALVFALRSGQLAAVGFTTALGPLGLLAGAAAGAALAFGRWGDSIDDATRSLASQAAQGGAVQGMIADAERAQAAYKSAIAATAGAQTSASNSIVADTKREFEAKKALLEMELKRQRALLAVQQADLQAKGQALKSEIGQQVFTRNSAVERGFSDPRIGDFVRLPDDITGLEKTRQVIANSPITSEIEKIRAEMTLTEVGARKLEKADEYDRMRQRIAEATAATIAETEAQRTLNPIIEDYGYALEKARAEHELLTAAQEAGKAITPQLREEIFRLAEAYASAVMEAGRLREQQDELRQAADEFRNSAKDMASGFISDLREGKSAAEAFAGALDKIIDKLVDVSLNNLFGTGGAGGGLFSGNYFTLNRGSRT